ncbi:MAG: acyl-CoA dehydrogenase family protein [Chloroflexi bacterium]|nr:acyl-CoA dehydrogenase family protein [Chloroflexota bacterium]
MLEECLVTEELAYGCSGISTAMGVNGLAILPILIAGTEAQKQEYGGRLADGQMAAYCLTEPEAGSDVAGIKPKPVKRATIIFWMAAKLFYHWGHRRQFLYRICLYRPRGVRYKGMSCFIVERDWEGVSVGKPFDKLGQHASDAAEVVFDGVKVPETHLFRGLRELVLSPP